MKITLAILVWGLLPFGATALGTQWSGHKSEAEVSKMTPERRVEEYCREYVRHGLLHSDYRDLIKRYISLDAIRAVAHVAKILDEYDPTRPVGRSREKVERTDDAIALLPQLDANVVRLRASGEGRTAIEVIRRLMEKMRAAHFDTAEPSDYNQSRYKVLVIYLKELEGINGCDRAIQNTLKLRYKISLSDKELLDFVNHLISQDPYYPGWSEREEYKDLTQRNEAGYPLWFVIVKNPEPFYQAYLKYQARDKSTN
ncbi:MAG TPA: hypothetical protein VNO70_11020 [Blastocatellia bacterium]|nr:hypothetical protein [Blastocatellia bacterium]